MSKESNNKPKMNQTFSMPGGMRGLVDKVFDNNKPADNSEIVQKTHEPSTGTISESPEKNGNGLINFRDFLEEYKNSDPYDRNTVYLTSDVKDILDKLKASRELKKYSLKDILNSIIHAYILEHKGEVIDIITSKQNNIID